MKIETIGVIGAGQMGNGIAHVAAFTGMKVTRIDGRPHHIVGVQPTHPVQRTLAGIRAGRNWAARVRMKPLPGKPSAT